MLHGFEASSTSADLSSGSMIDFRLERASIVKLQPGSGHLSDRAARCAYDPAHASTHHSERIRMTQDDRSGREFPQIQQDLSQRLLRLRKPADFLINLIYNISAFGPLRVCIETGVFQYLTQTATSTNEDVSAEELSKTLPWTPDAGIDPEAAAPLRRDFIVRMLRQTCALGLVDEGTKPFMYRANDLTREMADPKMASGFLLVFDGLMSGSTMGSLLSYAQQNSFCPPTSAKDGPYQHARGITGISTFDHWVHQEPEQLSRLSSFMSRVQKDREHWTEWFPSEVLFPPARKSSPDRVFMVDVGGGLGHDLLAFTEKYQDADLRFELQELPSVVEQAKTEFSNSQRELDPRISMSAHDFFSDQPVQGAAIYFMHKIMHDWPDADCVRILTRLRDAMADDSSIFVNEVIIPAKGASFL